VKQLADYVAPSLALLTASLAFGCRTLGSAAYWVGMPLVYRDVDLPEKQVVRDVRYRVDEAADDEKHRLDLFLPEASAGWPVLVFVHGGGWTTGDKSLRVGGRDVYGNIGRFYAARGIGSAVISYRLQPGVEWSAQVDDVAHALAWVHQHIGAYGGDPAALFLAGHSAGAQLAAHVVLNAERLARAGVPAESVCGWISVSGAALDLADEVTYRLGASRAYYAQRFRNGDPGESWKRVASPVRFARAEAPPALILYAEGEPPTFRRQAELLDAALRGVGAESRVVQVPGENHYRIVPTLSRSDKLPAPEIERFIRAAHCGA